MARTRGLNLVRCITAAAAFVSWTGAATAGPEFPDPMGDTFGVGAVQLDISKVKSTISGGGITFTIDFFTAISPASLFAADSLDGIIDIDTDQNAGTGGWPTAPGPPGNAKEALGPGPPGSSSLGDEFWLDLLSEQFTPGMVDLVDTSTGLAVGSVPIVFGPMSLSVTVPLALLGGDDGLLNYGAIIGTFAEATDEATNPGDPPATSVPLPPSLVLGGLSSLSVALLCWRQRRKQAA